MVNISKSENSIKFVFTDSDHYLYGNGEIEVPVNSLLLAIDESEMVTFKKLSGDPFLSFRADNSNLGTKEAIEQFYKENMVGSTGGGDVTIDPTLDSGSTNPVANSAITTALDAKQDVLSQVVYSIEGKDRYTANHNGLYERFKNPRYDYTVTSFFEFGNINGKSVLRPNGNESISWGGDFELVEKSAITSAITSASTNDEVAGAKAVYDAIQAGGGMDDGTQQLISTAFNDLNDRKADLTELSKYQIKGDYVRTSTFAETISDYMTNDAFDEYATAKERIISGALNDLDNRMIAVESGGSVTVDSTLDSGSTNPVQNAVITQALNAKADTSAITTAITSGSTDSEIPTAKATYDAIQAGGGGGATYSAGTNISIDTANTINCTLPITGNNSSIIMTGASNSITADNRFSQVFGTGNTVNAYGGYSQYCITVEGINNSCGTQATHVEGGYNQGIYGSYSHVEGAHNKLEISISPYDEVCSHVEGKYNKVLNYSEHASGQYNNSVSVSTTFGDGGNTLFSVGNGTSDSARHNAFEIRQNGDIYVNDGTNDVRLQDTILALGGLKLVKLTQAEYDALATKDSSTLYIISD